MSLAAQASRLGLDLCDFCIIAASNVKYWRRALVFFKMRAVGICGGQCTWHELVTCVSVDLNPDREVKVCH